MREEAESQPCDASIAGMSSTVSSPSTASAAPIQNQTEAEHPSSEVIDGRIINRRWCDSDVRDGPFHAAPLYDSETCANVSCRECYSSKTFLEKLNLTTYLKALIGAVHDAARVPGRHDELARADSMRCA